MKAPSLANIHSAIRQVYIMAWPCRKRRKVQVEVEVEVEEPVKKKNTDKKWTLKKN